MLCIIFTHVAGTTCLAGNSSLAPARGHGGAWRPTLTASRFAPTPFVDEHLLVGPAQPSGRPGLVAELDAWSAREAASCLEAAAAQAARIARLELARLAYQRPLEQWLLLDAALFLEEHGYAARLQAFCAESVSPRNLLVIGARRR